MGFKYNLEGQRFGKLVVLADEGKRAKDGSILWPYICDCGNMGYRTTSRIRKAKSCGKCINSNYKDLRGQRFGKLTVIDDDGKRTKRQQVEWLCLCDCGTYTRAITSELKNGHKTSCGCLRSKGELKLTTLLNKMQITFLKEWSGFKNNLCVNLDTGHPLRFDFYLPDYNCCLEFDGKQHESPTGGWYTEEKYNELIKRDKIKEEYCSKNNLKLIRIKYYNINLLNDDFIKAKIKGE